MAVSWGLLQTTLVLVLSQCWCQQLQPHTCSTSLMVCRTTPFLDAIFSTSCMNHGKNVYEQTMAFIIPTAGCCKEGCRQSAVRVPKRC
jgi:hypothetical protein